MGVSRFSVSLAVIAALVIGFLLGAAQIPVSATPPPIPCSPQDLSGMPLFLYDLNANGEPRCLYGEPHDPAQPCYAVSEDGRLLKRAVTEADGQHKCVYESAPARVVYRGTGAQVQAQPPESTREATP